MSKKYLAILIDIQDECVTEAIQAGIGLADAGFTHVYHYRSGVLVATQEEISDDYDHTQFPLVPIDGDALDDICALGLYREYSEDDNVFVVSDVISITK